tara:strand:+ start:398 stop:649 length:252 start_codon:yes stop_codon:yes gene_type:complete
LRSWHPYRDIAPEEDRKKGVMMTVENNQLEELIVLLESAREDYAKFYDRRNAAAGTRVRKTMQQVRLNAQEIRLHVQDTKNRQ